MVRGRIKGKVEEGIYKGEYDIHLASLPQDCQVYKDGKTISGVIRRIEIVAEVDKITTFKLETNEV